MDKSGNGLNFFSKKKLKTLIIRTLCLDCSQTALALGVETHTEQVQSCWKIWISGSDLHTALGVGRVIICGAWQTTGAWSHRRWNNVCRQLGTGGFTPHTCWTLPAHSGRRKHTKPINRGAVKETRSLFFFFSIFEPLRGWNERRDALFPRRLGGWSRAWRNTCCVAQWLQSEVHRYPSCGEKWHIFKLWTTNRGRGQWTTVEIFVLQSLAAFKPRRPSIARDKAVEGHLRCAFGWRCSTSPCR